MAGQVNVLITDPEYLEFMDVAVDKATALPELAGYYGLEVENVLAVGDADNDLRMVQSAGIGVAVANAKAGVLDAAAFVTRRSNNEGAVAEAVERWVLGEGALAGLWD
jgi:hydroxymethylpyrimidine pyrophosphatase-like HAD family hydrolase